MTKKRGRQPKFKDLSEFLEEKEEVACSVYGRDLSVKESKQGGAAAGATGRPQSEIRGANRRPGRVCSQSVRWSFGPSRSVRKF